MSAPSDPRLLVLHGLRLKGVAGVGPVAAAVGLDDADVEARLPGLVADGLVVERTGLLAGWSLTPAGRVELERVAAAELDERGARDVVESAYRRFGPLNAELKRAVSDWQVRPDGTRNDHGDAEHDRHVLERLEGVHRAAVALLDGLADVLARYEPFRRRLDEAAARIAAGDHDAIARPVVDSYHTIWFELHEDLLTSLGRRRHREEVA